MATIAAVVRWADNTDQLRRNLEQGLDQIEAMTKSADKLAKSLGGENLIRSAHNYAAAVEKMGGAEKLTIEKKEAINRLMTRAIDQYDALGKKAPQALYDLAAATEGTKAPLISMSSLLQGAVAGATAAVTAKVLQLGSTVASFAADSIARGSQIEVLRQSFDALSGGADRADDRLRHLRSGSLGLVDDMALIQSANKAMLLGLGLSEREMGDLARTATVLGRAMGQDATKSLDDLITALGRSSPMILDNLGLTVKVGEANETYAEQLGKTASQLTEAERKQAFMAAAMDAARVKVAELGEPTLTAAEQGSRLWTSFVNLTDAASNWLVTAPGVQTSIRQLSDGMRTLEVSIREGPTAAWREYQREQMGALPQIERAKGLYADASEGLRGVALGHDALFAAMEGTSAELEKSNAAVQYANELTKASDGLFGRDTIDKAQLLVTALGGVENISRLTADAKRALRTQVLSALEAYQALGKDAPLALLYVRDATEQLLLPSIDHAAAAWGLYKAGVSDASAELAAYHPLAGRAVHVTAQMAEAAERAAFAIGGTLAPTIQQVKPELDKEASGWTATFGQFAAGLPQVILGAIQGGGSVVGAAGAHIGTSLMSKFSTTFGPAIKAALPFGIGEAVTALLPALGALFGPVAEKIAGFFKKIFGGPSAEEVRGREAVAAFEAQLRSTLTATQNLESGGESWKQTVIAIRDAYIANGLTEREALADAERLWKSSTISAAESARVIAEIEAKMKASGEAGATAVDKIGTALDQLPDVVDIDIRGHYRTYEEGGGLDGYAKGTLGVHGRWFSDFGAGRTVRVHGEEAIVPRGQAGDFAAAYGGGGGDGSQASLTRIERYLRQQHRVLARAVTNALVVQGATR